MSLEKPCPFYLIIFNTNSELLQNRIEKQIMPFQTTVNWVFNDIWRYLVISWFDWKFFVFSVNSCNDWLYPELRKSINKNPYLIVSLANLNAKSSNRYKHNATTYEGSKIYVITSQFSLQQSLQESTHINWFIALYWSNIHFST